jgi:hypothetical protein
MAAAAALQSVLPPEVGARRDAYYFTVDCDALARRGYAVRCMVADCQLAELRLVSVAPSSEPSPDDLHLPDGFDIAEETCAELLQGITRAVRAPLQRSSHFPVLTERKRMLVDPVYRYTVTLYPLGQS